MRLVIYDANPGPGLNNAFLKTAWQTWAWKQKQTGEADAVFGARYWSEAILWARQQKRITSLQYWGHGSSGAVWCGGDFLSTDRLEILRDFFAPDGYLWFRTCYTFKSLAGRLFARKVSDTLGVKVAGHTKLIGLTQPGLQILKPNESPNWLEEYGETVWCFQSKLPDVTNEKNKT